MLVCLLNTLKYRKGPVLPLPAAAAEGGSLCLPDNAVADGPGCQGKPGGLYLQKHLLR